MHGLHSAEGDDGVGAGGQVDAAEKWLGGRSGLVIGDFNGTLCRKWRSGDPASQSAMDRRLRELVGWRCHCGAGKDVCKHQLGVYGRVVGRGWDDDGAVRWTRRDRRSSARLDFAVKLNGGEDSWVERDPVWCEGARAAIEEEQPSDLLSDHALCSVAAVTQQHELRAKERRPAPNRLDSSKDGRAARNQFAAYWHEP